MKALLTGGATAAVLGLVLGAGLKAPVSAQDYEPMEPVAASHTNDLTASDSVGNVYVIPASYSGPAVDWRDEAPVRSDSGYDLIQSGFLMPISYNEPAPSEQTEPQPGDYGSSRDEVDGLLAEPQTEQPKPVSRPVPADSLGQQRPASSGVLTGPSWEETQSRKLQAMAPQDAAPGLTGAVADIS